MEFLETPRFPEKISYGATGGPGYKTDVTPTGSGNEKRNIVWYSSRCSYDVSHVRTKEESDELIAFFRGVKGRAYGFRYKDWSDFEVTQTNGYIGSGVGANIATLQLYKRYTVGALVELRKITKLVAGTVSIYKNGILQTLNTHYTIDINTGLVTFVAPFPTDSHALRWAGQFDVPVRFADDQMKIRYQDADVLIWDNIQLVEIR